MSDRRERRLEGARGVFVDELKYERAKAGLSQPELGKKIGYSGSLVAMIETGRRSPTQDVAKRSDTQLGTDGKFDRIWKRVKQESVPSVFWEWEQIEREATTLRWWSPLVIPGLLQTEAYARELLRRSQPTASDAEIEEHVTTRMERQQILDSDNPPLLIAAIDGGVLRREVGGPQVMREQLAHLLELAARPKIVLQVVPLSAGAHPGLAGSMIIASFDGAPDVAYLDTALTGQLVEGPEDVAAIAVLYDTLRAEALPVRASLEFITQEMNAWT